MASEGAPDYRWQCFRRKGRFVKKTKAKRIESVVQANKRRKSVKICENEHVADNHDPHTRADDIDVERDSVETVNKLEWNDGRRIVELGFLAEHLNCTCGSLLHLSNISEERRYALGSVLFITCTDCGLINEVPTGKHHPNKTNKGVPVFDINTKLAAVIATITPLRWRNVNCENGGSTEPFFFWTRPGKDDEPRCQLHFSKIRKGVESKQIIISQMLPASMSRWSQWMTTGLRLDLSYDPVQPLDPHPNIHLEMKLGHVFEDNYTYVNSDTGQRTLDCELLRGDDNKLYYRCLLVPLFQLSSVSCPLYSLYIRITTDKSSFYLDQIKSTSVFGFSQDEEFTKLWFSVKTGLFLLQTAVLIKYMRRIHQPQHTPKLIERYLHYLGWVLMACSTPLEVLTLFFDFPFMRVINSIREVALCTMFLVFIDAYFQRPYTGWKRPRRILTVLACLAFLLYQLIDRIIPLVNPFRSLRLTRSDSYGITCGFALLIFAYLASLEVSSMKWWINKKVDNAYKLARKKLIDKEYKTFLLATLTALTFIVKMLIENSPGGHAIDFILYLSIYFQWNWHVITMMFFGQLEFSQAYIKVSTCLNLHI